MEYQSEATWERLFKLAARIIDLIMAEIDDPQEAYFVGTFIGEYTRYFFRKSIPMCMDMDPATMTKLDRTVKRDVRLLLRPEMLNPPLED